MSPPSLDTFLALQIPITASVTRIYRKLFAVFAHYNFLLNGNHIYSSYVGNIHGQLSLATFIGNTDILKHPKTQK